MGGVRRRINDLRGSRVSQEGGAYRATSPFRCKDLRGYRVSRPLREHLAAFLDHDRHVQPDHRPGHLPVDRGQRIAGRGPRTAAAHQAPDQPVVSVVETILPPPDLAGPSVPLTLTGRVSTHALTTARSCIAQKPPPADATTASSPHVAFVGYTARGAARLSRPHLEQRRNHPGLWPKTGKTIRKKHEGGKRRKGRTGNAIPRASGTSHPLMVVHFCRADPGQN